MAVLLKSFRAALLYGLAVPVVAAAQDSPIAPPSAESMQRKMLDALEAVGGSTPDQLKAMMRSVPPEAAKILQQSLSQTQAMQEDFDRSAEATSTQPAPSDVKAVQKARSVIGVTPDAPKPGQAPPRLYDVIQNSTGEVRESWKTSGDNLAKGIRGEIDPEEIRRAKNKRAGEGASFKGDIRVDDEEPADLAGKYVRLPPSAEETRLMAQQKMLMDKYTAALQTGNSAAIAGLVQQMQDNGDALNRATAARMDEEARIALGAPKVERLPQEQAAVTARPKKTPAKAPHTIEDPAYQKRKLLRQLADAHGELDKLLIEEEKSPGDLVLVGRIELARKRISTADEQYREFLQRTSPQEYEAYVSPRKGDPGWERTRIIPNTPGLKKDSVGPLPEYAGPNGNGPGSTPPTSGKAQTSGRTVGNVPAEISQEELERARNSGNKSRMLILPQEAGPSRAPAELKPL